MASKTKSEAHPAGNVSSFQRRIHQEAQKPFDFIFGRHQDEIVNGPYRAPND